MRIRPYEDQDERQVIALGGEVLPDSAPHNEPGTGLCQKPAVERDLLSVAVSDGAVIGMVRGTTMATEVGSTPSRSGRPRGAKVSAPRSGEQDRREAPLTRPVLA